MMKRAFKYYSVIWAVLFVLFNVIAFVSAGWAGHEKYTSSFWTGYVLIAATLIGQLVCGYFALKNDDFKKTFYHISLITTSYTGLILSFIFGGFCMLISQLPYWVGIILCAIVLAFNIIAVVKAAAAIEIVSNIDDKIKAETFFVKSLTVEAEGLSLRAQSEAVKAECKKVYEAVRYSDPMSNPALASLESNITVTFSKFTKTVAEENAEQAAELADEIMILLSDRNKKCKLLK